MSSGRSDDADRLTDRRGTYPALDMTAAGWPRPLKSPPKPKSPDRIARHKILCWGHEPNHVQHNRQEERHLEIDPNNSSNINKLRKSGPREPRKILSALAIDPSIGHPKILGLVIHSERPSITQVSHSLLNRPSLRSFSPRPLIPEAPRPVRPGMTRAPRHYPCAPALQCPFLPDET